MKFITFNTDTVDTGRSNLKPRILFSTGATNINPTAVAMLKLEPGMKVAVHQEEEGEMGFYLSVGDPKGFELRGKNNDDKDKTLTFNCSSLARGVIKALNLGDDKSVAFQVIEEPISVKIEGGVKRLLTFIYSVIFQKNLIDSLAI